VSRHNITTSKICNLDETRNSPFQVFPKFISAKGIVQLDSVCNVTVIADVNGTGSNVRPVLIFSRVHFKNDMLTGASAFPIGGANPTVLSN